MTAANRPHLFERLQVLDDAVPRSAALNMALDEALLPEPEQTPLLRVYRWARPAVSFGYFESWADTATRFSGRELVRRWTGGGAVEHGEDFTYSLLVPRTHPLTNLPAGESYRLIHLSIQRCLEQMGGESMELSSAVAPTNIGTLRECFSQPVQHDLLQNGRKLAGAAQRRTRRGLLHQGSLRLPDGGESYHEQLKQRLPTFLAATQIYRGIESADFCLAEKLVTEKYGTALWTRQR